LSSGAHATLQYFSTLSHILGGGNKMCLVIFFKTYVYNISQLKRNWAR